MKRLAVALGSAIFVTVVMALPALADSTIPKPNGGTGGTGGTAFTGPAGVGHATTLFAVLAILGVSALALAVVRRRHAA